MQSMQNYGDILPSCINIKSLKSGLCPTYTAYLNMIVYIANAQQAHVGTELGSTGLGALIDALVEVGLDDASFILKVMYL